MVESGPLVGVINLNHKLVLQIWSHQLLWVWPNQLLLADQSGGGGDLYISWFGKLAPLVGVAVLTLPLWCGGVRPAGWCDRPQPQVGVADLVHQLMWWIWPNQLVCRSDPHWLVWQFWPCQLVWWIWSQQGRSGGPHFELVHTHKQGCLVE